MASRKTMFLTRNISGKNISFYIFITYLSLLNVWGVRGVWYADAWVCMT